LVFSILNYQSVRETGFLINYSVFEVKVILSIVFSGFLFLTFSPQTTTAQSAPKKLDNGIIVLEKFEEDSIGSFPKGWYDRDGNNTLLNHDPEIVKDYNYTVKKEDSNKFLRYEGTSAKHINFPLIDKKKNNIYGIDIYKTPKLSWKVRAHTLPVNANEEVEENNDSVASVYVVFDFGRVALFKKVPKTIRYSWSSTLPEGTVTSKLFGNQQIKVVKSGNEDLGKWITFEVNLVNDYRRLFGDDPPETPIAILLLSDGDSTGSFVKADYDDLMLKPEK